MSTSTTATSEHKHPGPGRYVLVWAALLVFTALTVGLGRIHLPGGWSIVVAMAIAVVKSTLVVLFFMHLWDHGGANRLVLATTLVFVALLIGIVLLDTATRLPVANPPTEATMGAMPPGPDILTPRAPEPAHH
jgi:cytochrome c oxidase subunit 4